MNTIYRDQKKNSSWKMLALYGSMSLNLGCIIAGGYFLGKLLEEHYHWENMKTTGILTGLLLGLYQMFSFAYRSAGKK